MCDLSLLRFLKQLFNPTKLVRIYSDFFKVAKFLFFLEEQVS